jgi:GPH family glycoside/pentoside/hexuronide:cation symporter
LTPALTEPLPESAAEGVPPENTRISWGVVLAYGPPLGGLGACFFFTQFYLMKFATDVLLIAPAAMGLIFAGGRLWDAVSDPLVGYWSDRTRSRRGRRRPWMLGALIPFGVTFVMVWSPPRGLSEAGLVAWLAVAMFGFYAAFTAYSVPHQSLGAELTTNHHDRSRIFGSRHAFWMLSMMLAFGAMEFVDGASDPRAQAVWFTSILAIVAVIVLLVPPLRLPERSEYSGRGSGNPVAAMRDVLRNPHARVLLAVWFIESLGSGVLGVGSPYITEYVVRRPDLIGRAPAVFFVATVSSIPVWVMLSRRFGKRNVWRVAMLGVAFSFGSMGFLQAGNLLLLFSALAVAGAFFGCGGTIGLSILADVIDYDEYQTGERKEGAYSAAFGFALKAAIGITALVMGFALQLSGFVPNAEQPPAALMTLRVIFAGFPFVGYLVGAWVMWDFSFNESEHAAVRAELDRRRLS